MGKKTHKYKRERDMHTQYITVEKKKNKGDNYIFCFLFVFFK